MSCIASCVSNVSAVGSTRTKRPSGVSTVSTPSVVTSRYGVSSWPIGSSSVNSNSGMRRGYDADVSEGKLTPPTGKPATVASAPPG